VDRGSIFRSGLPGLEAPRLLLRRPLRGDSIRLLHFSCYPILRHISNADSVTLAPWLLEQSAMRASDCGSRGRRTKGLAQAVAAVGIFSSRSAPRFREQGDGVCVSAITAQWRAVCPVLAWDCTGGTGRLQEEIDDGVVAVFHRGPQQARAPSALLWHSPAGRRLIEEKGLEPVEAAEAGGCFPGRMLSRRARRGNSEGVGCVPLAGGRR